MTYSSRTQRVAVQAERRRGTLRFPTIAVDQDSGSASRQPDVGPVLEGISSVQRRMENAGREEFLPPASERSADPDCGRHEFGDDAAVSRHRHPFACFNAPDVAAQVVSQLSDPDLHSINIATSDHCRSVRIIRCELPSLTAPRRTSREGWSQKWLHDFKNRAFCAQISASGVLDGLPWAQGYGHLKRRRLDGVLAIADATNTRGPTQPDSHQP